MAALAISPEAVPGERQWQDTKETFVPSVVPSGVCGGLYADVHSGQDCD